MVKCVFCGKEGIFYRGIHLITNEGDIKYFCSSKCKKNALKLKRDNRKIKWTEAFHLNREKAREKVRTSARKEEEKKKEEKQAEKLSEKEPKKSRKRQKKEPGKKE